MSCFNYYYFLFCCILFLFLVCLLLGPMPITHFAGPKLGPILFDQQAQSTPQTQPNNCKAESTRRPRNLAQSRASHIGPERPANEAVAAFYFLPWPDLHGCLWTSSAPAASSTQAQCMLHARPDSCCRMALTSFPGFALQHDSPRSCCICINGAPMLPQLQG